MLKKNVFFMGLMIFLGHFTCFASEQKSSMLIDPVLLKSAGLELVYQVNVPVKKDEGIKAIYVANEYVFAITGNNYMVCFNRADGRMHFINRFSAPGIPVNEPYVFDDKLLFVVGKEIKELDPKNGIISHDYQTKMLSIAPVVRNTEYLYHAGVDARVRAYTIDDFTLSFMVTADDDSHITSMVADDYSFVFVTSSGTLVSLEPNSKRKMWFFDIGAEVKTPLVKDDKDIYATSLDSNVYKFDSFKGNLHWRTALGERLTRNYFVGKELIYVPTSTKGVVGINKETGSIVWQSKESYNFLSEKNGRAYLITKSGVMVVMDNVKGKQLYSLNVSNVTDFAANTYDGDIYLADEDGSLVCVRPIK